MERQAQDELLPDLVRIGADVSSLSAVQLTRLPCCERLGRQDAAGAYQKFQDGPRMQRLFFLVPRRCANYALLYEDERAIEDGGGLRRHNKNAEPQQTPDSTHPVIVFPSAAKRPTFACYDEAFFVGNKLYKAGVYFHETKQKTDEDGDVVEVLVDRWICSVLKVICIVRASTGNEHSYLIEYVPHGEKAPRRSLLSQALLLGRPEEPLKALRDLGVSVLYVNTKAVRSYLDLEHMRFSEKTPDDFWRSVPVVGWEQAPTCFVLPNETLGNHSGVWFSGKCDGTIYSKEGSLDDWKNNVAPLCEKNPFAVFAISSAFAGPLLELVNVPGIGLHLYGDSTNGKSTTLAVAVSAWGPPSFLLSWRRTVNGLEIQAAARSSTLLVLDESHMIPPKDLDAAFIFWRTVSQKAA